MTDPELRESRQVAASGFSRAEPIAPDFPGRSPTSAVATAASPKVFIADGLGGHAASGQAGLGQDPLGIETPLSLVAELIAHKNAELPFCIGILGGAGSGKSFALARLGAAVERFISQKQGPAETSFLNRIQVVYADAATLDGEPTPALTSALCADLGQSAPQLVEDAWRAVRDPHAAVTEAAERLDQAQRRLHVERDSLNEVEGRRARLFDTLLYETPGSQVDAYARTYRPRIASRLQSFGFSGDPILSYKDLVASLAAVQGPGGKMAMGLRALWAFKGQTRLLVYAFILALIGVGIGWAVAHQALWLAPFRSSNATLAATVAWLEAHMDTIASIGQAAFIGAALAVAVNLWRAFRFLQPVLRGVTLLKTEFANRRHEMDSAAAHQIRRVDGLAAEVERTARLHAEADHHAGATTRQGFVKDNAPFQKTSETTQALHVVTVLSALIVQKPIRADAPQRIVVMLDNLDAVAPRRACEILDAAHRLLAHPAFVMVIAANPQRLAEAGHDVQTHLEKWIQVPVRIDAGARDHAAFVSHLIAQSETTKGAIAPVSMDTLWSNLDQPLSDEEAQLLRELAPLAGPSARSLKRFVNLYRLTRPLLPEHWAALAFMLALKAGGREGEIGTLAQALAGAKPGADLALSADHTQLSEALMAVRRFESGSVAEAIKDAASVAAYFSF